MKALFRERIRWITIELIVALLIILWIYTGLNKILDHDIFITQLKKSPFISPFAIAAGTIIPKVEILLALMLIYKRTRMLGLYLSFALMLLFTGYVWMMLYYAYDLPCSCGGVLTAISWNEHLWFNTVFTSLALIGLFLQFKINQKIKLNKILT